METIQIKKSFVLEAHKAACQDWKSKIEKECPELFKPEFKVGDWLFDNVTWRIKRISSMTKKFFAREDNGTPINLNPELGYYRLATPSEIEKHLIALAKQKGFKEGVRFKGVSYGQAETVIYNNNIKYYPEQDQLVIDCNTAYLKGKWATIIEEPFVFTGKIMTAEIEGKKFQVKIIEEVK